MEDEVTAEDWRGNFIRVGDKVLYPRMSGRSCEMQEGEVLKITPREDTRYVENADFNPDDLTSSRWIHEPFTNYRYRIQPTRSSRRFTRWGGAKPVTIHIGENVTALRSD